MESPIAGEGFRRQGAGGGWDRPACGMGTGADTRPGWPPPSQSLLVGRRQNVIEGPAVRTSVTRCVISLRRAATPLRCGAAPRGQPERMRESAVVQVENRRYRRVQSSGPPKHCRTRYWDADRVAGISTSDPHQNVGACLGEFPGQYRLSRTGAQLRMMLYAYAPMAFGWVAAWLTRQANAPIDHRARRSSVVRPS